MHSMDLLLLALFSIFVFIPSAGGGGSPNGDRLALLSFKSHLSDPTGSLSSWNSTITPCLWLGVTCSSSSGRVTVLNLDSFSLSGPISSSLSNLTFLSTLYLSINSFTGPIPSSLSSLRNLSSLHLNNNNLTGDVPSWLGRIPTLRFICLSRNSLTGHIPDSIGNLRKLTSLDLSANSLDGPIPPYLGNCTALVFLGLAQNKFSGSVPESLVKLTALETLDLYFNFLEGRVPSSLYNISSVTYFSLARNLLTGRIPATIWQTLPMLQVLMLEGNEFDGPIPSALGNASRIKRIDLYDNQFSGMVPSNFGWLPQLNDVILGWNQLEAGDWSFLTSLTNCSKLKILILSRNKLTGHIPADVGNLPPTINTLAFDENQISGPIPAKFGRLTNLTLLALNENQMDGKIPASFGKLQHLQTLDLSINFLSGEIPASLGDLKLLNELYLGANALQGSIPASIGNYLNLAVLNISHNRLSGTIPKEVVGLSSLTQTLDLSHNTLNGTIPPEVGRLNNLARLDVSHNQLSGLIPGGIGDCQVLQYLYVDNNQFEGPIPSQLKNLEGLQELDLSHNNFTGQIPEFLDSLTLHYLNLSFNNLMGSVPIKGVFTNGSAISLQGNGKLCGGDPMLKLPVCTIANTTTRSHGFHVLKMVIPVIVVGLFLILVAFFFYLRLKLRTSIISSSIPLSEDQYRKVSYSELHKATNGFSSENLTGVGSFGSVYKGRINGYRKEIAVKVLNLYHEGALKSFAAECEALRNIRHRNLVKVITSCATIDTRGNDFRALVFDFMPNGSLEDWLHPKELSERHNLSFHQRLKIAIDVASALEYLHDHGETPLVHCDLKPSNVLLDAEMNAHVGDFGLAMFIHQSISLSAQDPNSIAIKGSIGYVAPEYGMGEQPSIHGDTYSYGILILEMVTALRPTDGLFKDGLVLHTFVEAAYSERVLDIVDQRMFSSEEGWDVDGAANISRWRMQECLTSLIKVGLSCSQGAPEQRMKMRNVTVELREARNAYLG